MPLASTVVLSDEERVNGHRPSADVLFRSAALEFSGRTIGVLMTGMGDDGAAGLGMIKNAGGMTIAQTEDSCVVFGMPKAAIERGFAMRVVSLEMMANALVNHCNPERSTKEERVHLQL
jgi:two-component system chemotaxis response regulator CheB